MAEELAGEYRLSWAKRLMLRVSAVVLFCLGALPSIPLAIVEGSLWFALGGVPLVFFAYVLLVRASETMQITQEGVLLENRRGKTLLRWSEIGRFTQGEGIDRYKVAYTLVSDQPYLKVNLGLGGLSCRKLHHLPDTFGMRAKELAVRLEHMRKERIKEDGIDRSKLAPLAQRFLAKAAQTFSEDPYSVEFTERLEMVFPAQSDQVGDLRIWLDCDEVTVFTGHHGHTHFEVLPSDSVSLDDTEERVVQCAIDFMRDFLAGNLVVAVTCRGSVAVSSRVIYPEQDADHSECGIVSFRALVGRLLRRKKTTWYCRWDGPCEDPYNGGE